MIPMPKPLKMKKLRVPKVPIKKGSLRAPGPFKTNSPNQSARSLVPLSSLVQAKPLTNFGGF